MEPDRPKVHERCGSQLQTPLRIQKTLFFGLIQKWMHFSKVHPFYFYTPMQEVTPKVVAMAVSTVITMFRILLQSSFFISDFWFMIYDFFFTPQSTRSITEFLLSYKLWVLSYEFYSICHSLLFVIQRSKATKNLGSTKQWKQVDVLEILRFALDDNAWGKT